MDDATKDRLEELQAEVLIETGTRISQRELLDRLVEEAYRSKGDVIGMFQDGSLPLTDEERRAFHSGTVASTDSDDHGDDHDETIYA